MDPEVKPGVKSSEFWTHLLFGVLIAVIPLVVDMADQMPALAKIIVTSIAPVALMILQQQYAKGRNDLKKAQVEASAAVGADAAVTPGPGALAK